MQVLLLFRDGGANRSGDIALDKMVCSSLLQEEGAPATPCRALGAGHRGARSGDWGGRGSRGAWVRACSGRASRFRIGTLNNFCGFRVEEAGCQVPGPVIKAGGERPGMKSSRKRRSAGWALTWLVCIQKGTPSDKSFKMSRNSYPLAGPGVVVRSSRTLRPQI